MMQLDSIDRKILRALQTDGGLSTMALAEKIGISQSTCWRKLKSLEDNEVLGGLCRRVNAQAVGLAVNVICHVRLKDHLPESRLGFLRFVEARDEILGCFAMSGEWDYLLRVVVDSVEAYQNFLMHALLMHGTVGNAASHFALSVDKDSIALPV